MEYGKIVFYSNTAPVVFCAHNPSERVG